MAAEKGVALAAIAGTGPGGRVSQADVLAAAAAGARVLPLLQPAAQLTAVVEVDLTRVIALCDRAGDDLERRTGVRPGVTACCARAALAALRSYPRLNASIDPRDHAVAFHQGQHLGVVDAPGGPAMAVVLDAGDLNLLGLATQMAAAASRAGTGRAGPPHPTGATFTLTGSRGALLDTPILYPPQVATLSIGAVVERPVVFRDRDGNHAIAVRSMAYLALSYDARLVGTAEAAGYLGAVRDRLEAADFAAELR